jgi:hypothetical protein
MVAQCNQQQTENICQVSQLIAHDFVRIHIQAQQDEIHVCQ